MYLVHEKAAGSLDPIMDALPRSLGLYTEPSNNHVHIAANLK